MSPFDVKIDKSPLRPGLSYPLKPSVLDVAVVAAGVTTPIELHQRCETWWTEGVLFRADFYAPNYSSTPSPRGATLHVTCRSVPSVERQAARAFLEREVIPAFVKWLAAFEALPENSTAKRERTSFVQSWKLALEN